MEQLNKEPEQDHPVILRTDSNHPGAVTAYPAVHLSRYEMGLTGSLSDSPYVWCRVNGINTGVVR